MNRTKLSATKAGFALCGTLALVLAGCTTYAERSSTRTVYVRSTLPPPPPVVEIPPPPPPPDAPVVVIESENDFYEPLGTYGEWVVVPSYGRCWRPARVDAGWRPYSNGHWQRTDAGWYWASDEPWGWATYHYGRWDLSADFGWIWLPQTQWAPAWVSWRHGAGYVGWAPLPPSARIADGGVMQVRAGTLTPRAFVFVNERRLMEPVRPATVIVNNTTIINQTVNITNVKVENRTVINEGPRPDEIERMSGRKIQSSPVRQLRHAEEAAVVSRERNIRSAGERTAQPPVRAESGPPRPAPPSETRPTQVRTATPAPPTPPVNRAGSRETGKQPAPVTAAPQEARPPARNDAGRQTDKPRGGPEPVAQAATKPQISPDAKPAAPPRGVGTVEKPAAIPAQPQLSAARNQVQERGGKAPAIQPAQTEPASSARNGKRPEASSETARPIKPAIEPPAAVAKPTPPQNGRQVERPVQSPRDKSAAGKPSNTKKKQADEKKVEEQKGHP